MNPIHLLLIFLATPAVVYLVLLAWSLCRAAADRLTVDDGRTLGGDDE